MADDFTIRFPTLACDACGKPVEEGKKFCSHCGTPVDSALPLPLLCPYCNGRLSLEEAFCGACGKPVLRDPHGVRAVDDARGIVPSRSKRSGVARNLGMALGGLIAVLSVSFLALWLVAPERLPPVFSVAVPGPTDDDLPPVKAVPQAAEGANQPVFPPSQDAPARIPGESSTVAPDLPKTTVAQTQPVSSPPLSRPADARQVHGQVITPEGLLPIRIYGDAKTDSERSVEVIRERVEAALDPVRDSYTQALTRSSRLLGTLTLELTVGADGQVEQAIAHATAFADTALPQRVQDQARQWRFPPAPSGSVKIFYPLLFLPESFDPRAIIALNKELLPGRYKILAADPTSVHQEPSEEAPTVGTVSSGLKVYIVSSKGDWLGVLSPKGEVGYIKREAIASAVQSAQ